MLSTLLYVDNIELTATDEKIFRYKLGFRDFSRKKSGGGGTVTCSN